MRLAILTISTLGARGERNDSSGDAIAAWAAARGYAVADRKMIPDDVNAIVGQLIGWCDAAVADLVLTTGGTGLSPTDVTPEAMQSVVERDAPGIAEWLRAKAAPGFPRAVLSRGRAGIRHKTLIVNLPGSPGGVRDGLKTLEEIVEHAVGVLSGAVTSHD